MILPDLRECAIESALQSPVKLKNYDICCSSRGAQLDDSQI